jgi:tetratricopeptide (TPR) repeat protein
MHKSAVALALLSVLLAASLSAQAPARFNLVMPHGGGRLVVPSGPNWVPVAYQMEADDARITFTFEDHRQDITLRATLFPNDDGTAEACRDLTLTLLLNRLHNEGAVYDMRQGFRSVNGGTTIVTTSFLIATTGVNPGSQRNVYAFAAGPHTCAELHLTRSDATPATDPAFQTELDHMQFDPEYSPTSQDFNAIASAFYETRRDFRTAAVYYRRALETLPFSTTALDQRRTLTDQLAMSYAVYGDIKNSYNVNEAAIQQDPDYPFYYYNLACIDAELHNPLDAKRHLQQAFDRRRFALPSEPLPDPVLDTSLQKLQSDRTFWNWLRTLSSKNY